MELLQNSAVAFYMAEVHNYWNFSERQYMTVKAHIHAWMRILRKD